MHQNRIPLKRSLKDQKQLQKKQHPANQTREWPKTKALNYTKKLTKQQSKDIASFNLGDLRVSERESEWDWERKKNRKKKK